ncbi:MAG: hypothetical protein ABW167_09285 [Baekduia sp.]
MPVRPLAKTMLLAIVVAIASLAGPSASSATSWSTVGSTYVLDSSDLTFSVAAVSSSWTCTAVQMHVDVTSIDLITVTNADFLRDCHGAGAASGCTVTPKATGLHWTMTAPKKDDVTIHGIKIDFTFETRPPPDPQACTFLGVTFNVTGTLGPGTWHEGLHETTFTNAPGLTAHIPAFGSVPVLVTGTFKDTAQTLSLT